MSPSKSHHVSGVIYLFRGGSSEQKKQNTFPNDGEHVKHHDSTTTTDCPVHRSENRVAVGGGGCGLPLINGVKWLGGIPSGKLTWLARKCPCSTVNKNFRRSIFYCHVSLPEGICCVVLKWLWFDDDDDDDDDDDH